MPAAAKSVETSAIDTQRSELHARYDALAEPLAIAQRNLELAQAEVDRLKRRRAEIQLAIADAQKYLADVREALTSEIISGAYPVEVERIAAKVAGFTAAITELELTEDVLVKRYLTATNKAVTHAQIDVMKASIARLEGKKALHDFDLSISLANLALLDATTSVSVKDGLSDQLAAAINDHKIRVAELQASSQEYPQ